MKLMQIAREFRDAYDCVDSLDNEMMQWALIDEEFREFEKAAQFEPDAATLKELADLVYVCMQYAANMGWDLTKPCVSYTTTCQSLELTASLCVEQTVKSSRT